MDQSCFLEYQILVNQNMDSFGLVPKGYNLCHFLLRIKICFMKKAINHWHLYINRKVFLNKHGTKTKIGR